MKRLVVGANLENKGKLYFKKKTPNFTPNDLAFHNKKQIPIISATLTHKVFLSKQKPKK